MKRACFFSCSVLKDAAVAPLSAIMIFAGCMQVVADGPGTEKTISLDGCVYTRTFYDDFSDLHVQPWVYAGQGWTAHTPWAGDFGDAAFADPAPGFPFTRVDGVLQIEARKDAEGRWRSGLLASADGTGKGFGRTYGYFEMRAMLPKGEGVWPAFWLMTMQPKGTKAPSLEIDALEHYGRFPADFHSGFHLWNAGPTAPASEHITPVESGSLSRTFHNYGVDVEPDTISFYFDRRRTWLAKTPPEHRKPLLMLVDLALGSGWPTTNTPSPSVMKVAYVQVLLRAEKSCRQRPPIANH